MKKTTVEVEEPAVREKLPCSIEMKSKSFSTVSYLSNQCHRYWTMDILTDPKRLSIIQWVDVEFKLIDPEEVARLWVEQKNEPAMNCEELSRALRYYYDDDMLEEAKEERFVYRFIINSKEWIGFSA